MEPLDFTIATRDFDLFLLPDDDRQSGTDRFQNAVIAFYAQQFEPIGGTTVVGVDDETIHVQWIPDGVAKDPAGYVMTLLQSGRLHEAIPLLETLRQIDPDDPDTLYNLGMALSETGDLDRAKQHLERLTTIAPDHANGFVALGVARQRSGDDAGVIEALRQSLALQPGNGYAHRNLGAMLARSGNTAEALVHLRKAAELLPSDERSLFGLAQMLEETGDANDLEEADRLYTEIIRMSPDSDVGEAAKRSRSGLAQKTLQERSGGAPNMASVMYCLSALERFDNMTLPQIQAVAVEVAFLGQRGINPNDPDTKYPLRSIPSETFSALQLLSLMYVGFKRIAPQQDIGFDLSREYQTALQMHGSANASGSNDGSNSGEGKSPS